VVETPRFEGVLERPSSRPHSQMLGQEDGTRPPCNRKYASSLLLTNSLAADLTYFSYTVLETLVVRSLAEESLGTIQRDIPKVLEAFCGYLSAVEDARDELINLIKPETTDTKREEISRGIETLEPLLHGMSSTPSYQSGMLMIDLIPALSSAVENIVSTFGQRLFVFSFSQKTTRRLQSLSEQK
jgi:nucleoporin NDC1